MASRKEIEAALLKVIQEWGIKNVKMGLLIEAIEAGDIDRIMELLGVTRESMSAVLASITDTFIAAGLAQVNKIPKAIIGQASFGMGNQQVVDFLQARQYDLIKRITEEQRQVIRSILSDVATKRQNPMDAVKTMIGTKGPTGKRIGSAVGLSEPQLEYVKNARAELSDPSTMRKYLQRTRRNKQLDRIVRKALKDGVPLAPEDIDRLTAAYTDRLLRLRAETIARTEHKSATEDARLASLRHMVESGKITEDQITRIWDATDAKGSTGGKTRDSHREMDGQRVVGLSTPFRTPDGYEMMFPGDGSKALAKHVANCRCTMRIEIDYYKGLK